MSAGCPCRARRSPVTAVNALHESIVVAARNAHVHVAGIGRKAKQPDNGALLCACKGGDDLARRYSGNGLHVEMRASVKRNEQAVVGPRDDGIADKQHAAHQRSRSSVDRGMH